MSRVEVTNYTNSIGQVLKPGDKVVYVASGYNHSIHIKEGLFEGVVMDRPWSWNLWGNQNETQPEEVVAVKVGGVPSVKNRWNDETKKWENIPCLKKTTLPLCRVFEINTPLNKVADAI